MGYFVDGERFAFLFLKLFSPKQLGVIEAADARVNLLDGPVRSGKTMASIVWWINYVATSPHDKFLMTGKTKDTLYRNVLNDMFSMVGSKNYKYNKSEGVLHMFGKEIYCVGANDEKSEGRIRGMTVAGWYADEITLHPKSFVNQGLARTSIEGAKAMWTTNPDSPYHFIHQQYIEDGEKYSKGIVKRFPFQFDDNYALSDEYKESLKALYSGLWYKRMILGLWVLADGSVYDMWDEERHVITDEQLPSGSTRHVVGVDYGTNNPCVFLLIGLVSNKYYVLREYYYAWRENMKQKTDADYSRDFKEFVGETHIDTIYIDPSASSLIAQLHHDGINKITHANNDVLPGIQTVSKLLADGGLFVHESCKNVRREFTSYVWDENAQKRGEDKPKKEKDHCMDALRYAIHTDAAYGGLKEYYERLRGKEKTTA